MRTGAALLLLCAALSAQSISLQFEAEHSHSTEHNPPEVKLVIRTLESRPSYHMSDVIRIRLSFTSQKPRLFTAELASGGSVAGSNDDFVIQGPDMPVPIHSMPTTNMGLVCCESNRRYLKQKPLAATGYLDLASTWQFLGARPRDVSPSLPGLKPGDYAIFVQTRRVNRGWPKSHHDLYFTLGDTVVTSSNILHITVLPDVAETNSEKH
jgi:hypothetical protein